MKIVCITGNSGTGKTTLCKRFIEGAPSVIFDINGEYSGKTFFEPEALLNYLSKIKNKVVLIDEATAFFSYRNYSNSLNRLLQLRRHNNHFFIFVYHSIYFIPKYLRNYINYLIVFQQNIEAENDLFFCSKKISIPSRPFEFKTFKIM